MLFRSRNQASNIFASVIVVCSWGYLIYYGNVATIWPMFGVANQLLSAIALAIGSTILIKMNKAKYLWISAIPMVFMFTVTISCTLEQIFNPNFGMVAKIINPASPQDLIYSSTVNIILLSTILGLAVIVLLDSLHKWYLFLIKKEPYELHETSPPSTLSKQIKEASVFLS